MVSTFRSFVSYVATYPLRAVLTIVTIAIGVASLIITFSLSSDVTEALERSTSEGGTLLVVANGTLTADGSLERQLPTPLDAEVVNILARDVPDIRGASFVAPGRWNRIFAEGVSYQVRSSSAVDSAYASVIGLDLIAGSFFTAEDVEARAAVVVISETTARLIFGGAAEAVGGTIRAAVPSLAEFGGDGPRVRITQEPFRVVGVYADLSELEREAYGVGDFLIPTGRSVPAGIPIGFDPQTVIMARVAGQGIEAAEASIRTALEIEYGEDVAVSVWEGSPTGPTPLIGESRRTVRSFALTVNVLGVVVLLASSIGIFSIMLVEVLNRMREVGLRRALGATQASIRRLFLAHAVTFSLAGGIVGTGLAALFYGGIGASLVPFFESAGLSAADLNLGTPGFGPVMLAVASAAIIGGVFGFFPAISASRIAIVDAIRDDAA